MHKILENTKVDKNLTTNALIIIYIYLFFLEQALSALLPLFGYSRTMTKNSGRSAVVGVVTARLDTFGARFHFIFPYLFFQPPASFFFCSLVHVFPLLWFFVSGTKKKKAREKRVGGVTARLDTFGVRVSKIIYYIW